MMLWDICLWTGEGRISSSPINPYQTAGMIERRRKGGDTDFINVFDTRLFEGGVRFVYIS